MQLICEDRRCEGKCIESGGTADRSSNFVADVESKAIILRKGRGLEDEFSSWL